MPNITTAVPRTKPQAPLFVAWDDAADEAHRIMAEMPDIYTDIDERNGWVEPEERPIIEHAEPAVQVAAGVAQAEVLNETAEPSQQDQPSDEDLVFAANSMREVLTFCTDVRDLKNPKCLRQVLMRFLVVTNLLRPELLRKENLSTLAKTIDCTRSHLSQIQSLASRRWHYQSRVQRGPDARENHAEAARKSWEKRRQNQA